MKTRTEQTIDKHLFQAGAAFPFLREPLEEMGRVPDDAVSSFGTDGCNVFYAADAEPSSAGIRHMLMHCLFRHIIPDQKILRPYWNLACDISAEFLRTEFFPAEGDGMIRMTIRDCLGEGTDPRVPKEVYREITGLFEEDLEPLIPLFQKDDHRYWYQPYPGKEPADLFHVPASGGKSGEGGSGPGKQPFYRKNEEEPYEEWLKERMEEFWPSEEELPQGKRKTGRYGLSPGSREEKMILREEGKYDFTRYLRRFSTTREELQLDLGGFDYIPYYYGLMRNGNMPFIEPLEYSESHKVEELVIAIDTSGSCSKPVVERFLSEIERMLMRKENFFAKMNVYIIQCDAVIQSQTRIRSFDDWKKYKKDLVIKGRGGTNFIPVFDLVEKLIRQKELKELKGLLYFTDGDGVYPQKETPYETAFVFTTKEALERNIPEWIIPLCLDIS